MRANESVLRDLLGIGMIADDEIGDGLELVPIGRQQVVDDACAASSKVGSKLRRRCYSGPLSRVGYTE